MFNFSTFNDLLSLHKFNKNSPDNVYLIYIYKIYINQYGIFAFFFLVSMYIFTQVVISSKYYLILLTLNGNEQ